MMSPLELSVIGLIVVLLFGTRRLPELGSGLGKAISNFKRSYRESTEIDVTPQQPPQKPSEHPPTSNTTSPKTES
jgi:sec-independent protein translocase protein TatA